MVEVIESAAALTIVPLLMVVGVVLWARRDQRREHLRQSALWRQRFLGGD
jgi:hypothetical protein